MDNIENIDIENNQYEKTVNLLWAEKSDNLLEEKDEKEKKEEKEKNVFYIDELNKETIDLLDEIVVRKTEDSEKKGFLESLFEKNNDKTYCVEVGPNKSETTKKVIDIALTFFKNAGINVSENDGVISYISYDHEEKLSYATYDNLVENLYCVNEAYNGYYQRYHECIIVTKKGDKLNGGNMEVYKTRSNIFLTLIGYEEEKDAKKVYELKTGTVLVFDGNTQHKLKSFKGNGYFNFIIVTLRDMKALLEEMDESEEYKNL